MSSTVQPRTVNGWARIPSTGVMRSVVAPLRATKAKGETSSMVSPSTDS